MANSSTRPRTEILRLATAGSVDDGKSTLIGRLLYETKSVFADQLSAVERTSARRGDDYVDLALLTDGLRAEREQGITIDVAYRYFSSARRSFIIADTPGHVQYTRNMVTGASKADLAIILVDARKGWVEQGRRHLVIASLLRVPHVVVCINKMDLVGYDEDRFAELRDEIASFAARLEITDMSFIPVSALTGENVATRATAMDWYDGSSLLHHLEGVHIASDRNLIDARFPVQYVLRPRSLAHPDYRGYAGRVEAGVWRPGDRILALPTGFESTIAAVETADGPIEAGFPPMSLTIRLEDELDISRGDMLCRPQNRPTVGQDLEGMVCWMSENPLSPGHTLALKHSTRWARMQVAVLRYKLDTTTLRREEGAASLSLNEIGRLSFRTSRPLFYDAYRRNRTTGSFVLVDESTGSTVGAGMILGPTA